VAEEAQILCERVTFLRYTYVVCLVASEGKQKSLFAPTDIHKTSCNVQQLSVQMAIANLNYYLPFKMASSGYQTMCHVRLPVSDSSKSLPHSLVNRQADCGTAGHFCFIVRIFVLNKQSSNKRIFTALCYFPLYQHILCQYTYRTYLHTSCPVMYA